MKMEAPGVPHSRRLKCLNRCCKCKHPPKVRLHFEQRTVHLPHVPIFLPLQVSTLSRQPGVRVRVCVVHLFHIVCFLYMLYMVPDVCRPALY